MSSLVVFSTLLSRDLKEEFAIMLYYVLTAVVALVAGAALGFFLARRYMMDYLKKNPPINEQMLRVMMMQMGQKPSEKKIKQMMNQMNQHTK